MDENPVARGQMELGLVAERKSDVCACGGTIDMPADPDEETISDVMHRHVRSARHKEWRAMGGVLLPSDPQDVGHVAVEEPRFLVPIGVD